MVDLMRTDDPSETMGNVSLRPRMSRFGSKVTKPRSPLMGQVQLDLGKVYTPSPAGTADQGQQCKIPHLVLQYILDEMQNNAKSDEIKGIRSLNESNQFQQALKEYRSQNLLWKLFLGGDFLRDAQYADIVNQLAANAKFACLVADARARKLSVCGKWDHKPFIREVKGWGVQQLIDFNLVGHAEEINFYYDIWSNIHYGFVGRAAGFREEALLEGGAKQNWISNQGGEEPVSDRVSIQIGMDLYKEYGTMIDIMKLLNKLYENRHFLHRYDGSRPEGQRVYTK